MCSALELRVPLPMAFGWFFNSPDSDGVAHLVRNEFLPHVVGPLPLLESPAVLEVSGDGDLLVRRASGPDCGRVDLEALHPLDFHLEDTVSAGHVRDDVFPPGWQRRGEEIWEWWLRNRTKKAMIGRGEMLP